MEEKDATDAEREIGEVNTGIYCVEAEFLWRSLRRVGSSNAQGEFYLPDLVAMAAARGSVAAVEVPAMIAAGVNDRVELARVGRALTRRMAEAWARSGVTIEDLDRFDADEGVVLGQDVVIEPGVRLRGRTRVGADTVIGAGCILQDAEIGAGVTLKPYTVIEQARVEAKAIIGPFSRLRPGSEIGEGAHVGNFVETKKTKLGKGSKANHLTYLGDAEIGSGVNVGAGTITCATLPCKCVVRKFSKSRSSANKSAPGHVRGPDSSPLFAPRTALCAARTSTSRRTPRACRTPWCRRSRSRVTRRGATSCAGVCPRTCRASFRMPPAYIPSSARVKIRRECSPAKALPSAPTVASIT